MRYNSLTQEEFIKRSVKIHGDRYDYFKTVFVRTTDKVVVYCKHHKEEFLITPKMHLIGQGCAKCGRERQKAHHALTKQDFIIKSSKVHVAGSYDYSLVNYTNNSTKVLILCNTCGAVFSQRPQSHLAGRGCNRCGSAKCRDTVKKNSEVTFLMEAPILHEHKYDYSLVDFVDMSTKVTVICPSHKAFEVTPHHHITGKVGCPSCAISGYSKLKPGSIYVLKSGDMTKIGITNREPSQRLADINRGSDFQFRIEHYLTFEDGNIPYTIEKKLLKEFKTTYKQPDKVFDGCTECFVGLDVGTAISKIYNLTKGQYSSATTSKEV